MHMVKALIACSQKGPSGKQDLYKEILEYDCTMLVDFLAEVMASSNNTFHAEPFTLCMDQWISG